MLMIMGGMANGHEAAQRQIALNSLPLLHKLEQVRERREDYGRREDCRCLPQSMLDLWQRM